MNEELVKRTLKIAENNDTAGAIALQRELTEFVRIDLPPPKWNTVAGVDLSYEDGVGYAVIAVIERTGLQVVETVSAKLPVTFPYIPGFLAFRELPAFIEAYRKLKRLPDVWMFDGQGLAHPRRMGIASHAGLLLEMPSIGCAKSHLYGDYENPELEKYSFTPMRADKETIGYVFRSKTGCKPLFVSAGHLISHESSLEVVKETTDKYRAPMPTYIADKITKEIRGGDGVIR